MLFEYQVIAAPRRGEKLRGAKTPTDRFAHTLSTLMNQMARDGWEYVRAEALPSEERTGWTKRTVVEHHVLVFRREVATRSPMLHAVPVDQPANVPSISQTEGPTPPIGPARAV